MASPVKALGPPSALKARGDAFDYLTARERNALVIAARMKSEYIPAEIGYREVATVLGMLGRGGQLPPDYQERAAAELRRIRDKLARGAVLARRRTELHEREERRMRRRLERERRRLTERRQAQKEAVMAEDESAGAELAPVGEGEAYPPLPQDKSEPVTVDEALARVELPPAQERAKHALLDALAEVEERLQPLIAERGRIRRSLAELTGPTTVEFHEPEDVEPVAEEPPETPPEEERLDEKETGEEEDEPGEPPIREKAEGKAAERQVPVMEEVPPTLEQVRAWVMREHGDGDPFKPSVAYAQFDAEKDDAAKKRISGRLRTLKDEGVLRMDGWARGTTFAVTAGEEAASSSGPARAAGSGPSLEEVRDWVVRNHKDGESFWPAEVHVAFRVTKEWDKRRVSEHLKTLAENDVLARSGVGSQTQYAYVRPGPTLPGTTRSRNGVGPPDDVTGSEATPGRGRTVPGAGKQLLSRAPR